MGKICEEIWSEDFFCEFINSEGDKSVVVVKGIVLLRITGRITTLMACSEIKWEGTDLSEKTLK